MRSGACSSDQGDQNDGDEDENEDDDDSVRDVGLNSVVEWVDQRFAAIPATRGGDAGGQG